MLADVAIDWSLPPGMVIRSERRESCVTSPGSSP
jgi:hypothetical protein